LFYFSTLFFTLSSYTFVTRVQAGEITISDENANEIVIDESALGKDEEDEVVFSSNSNSDSDKEPQEDKIFEPVLVPTSTIETIPLVLTTPIDFTSQSISKSIWTFENVELNKEYVSPQNSEVRLTFTKLPNPSGNIKIEEIKLTKEQIEQTGSLSEKAYDITSDMKNGDFKYDLSLPIPESSKGKLIQVKYAEKISDIHAMEKIDNEITKSDTSVSVKSLDHFTIFIITDDEATYSTGTWVDYAAQGYFDDGVHYPTEMSAGQTAIWTFSGITPRSYKVYISWSTHDNRTQVAPYVLNYDGGPTTPFIINQEKLADQSTTGTSGQWSGWYDLGAFNLDSSSNIVLSSVDNSSGTAYVIADEVLLAPNTAPTDVWVDDDFTINSKNSGYVWGYDVFTNIQDGITAVASGGTVNVAAGTYTEVGQIVIDKDLTITGADKNTTIIKPSTNTTGNNVDSAAWLLVNTGVTFNLSNVTLDGDAPTRTINWAIASYGHGTINNIIIKNIKGGTYLGRGIVVFGDNTTVSNNTFNNIERIGVHVRGAYSGPSVGNATVTGNTYTCKGAGDVLDYGVEVGAGATATISNNTITNCRGEASSDNSTSAGILLTDYYGTGTTASITGNTITGSTYGIVVGYAGGDTTSVSQFDTNIFSNNDYDLDNYTVNNIDARNNTWSVTDQDNLDQIETKINHNCSNSIYIHGICSGTDDYSIGGMVQYKDIGTPTNSGWNIHSKSATPYETPLDVTCGGYTNENSVAQNWTAVSGSNTNIKYQREVTFPSSAVSTYEAGSNIYTPFSTFGSATGIEGLWKTRVKAYLDANSSNTYNSGEEVSGWSNYCNITFDKTVPDVEIMEPAATTLSGTVAVKGTITDTNPHHYYTVVKNSANTTVAGPGTVNNSSSFTDALLFNWNTTLVPDGVYTIRLEAKDAADNKDSGSVDVVTVTVDNTKPTVDLIFPTPGPLATSFEAVFSEDVNPTEAIDPTNYFLTNWPGAGGSGDLIGDATIVYNPANFTATVTLTSAGWYISPEQQWGVQDVHDLAGNLQNVNPYSEYSTLLVNPATTDSGTDTNWHNASVTVTLTCTDINGSGCKTTYYTTDGSTPTTSSATGNSVTLSTDGEFTIKYFSTDNAGNSETVKTASNIVKIDTTNPTGTLVINSGDTHTSNKTVTLTITGSDTLSGVSEMAFSNDDSTYSSWESFSTIKSWDLENSGGTKTVYMKLKDLAGNETPSFIASDSIILDSILPTSIITVPGNEGDNTLIYTNVWNGIISGTASDDLSVSNVQISIQRDSDEFYFNGSTWILSGSEVLIDTISTDSYATWTYDISPDPAGDETYTIISHATDVAGNFESSYKLTVIYDITIPQVSLSINPTDPDGDNGIYDSKPKIKLSASDNYDIDYIEYQINSTSGTWKKYTSEVKIDDDTKKFYYRSVDKAGNKSNVGLKNVKVDTKAPDGVENVNADYNSDLDEARVSWETNDSDIYTVKIYRSEDSNVEQNSSNFLKEVDKNEDHITDDNVDRGNTYYYLLVTYDEAGNEGGSVKVSITIPENANENPVITTERILAPQTAGSSTNNNNNSGEITGQVEGANTENNPTDNQDGSKVLGTEDENQDQNTTTQRSYWWWLLLLLPFLFWIIWLFINRERK